ncbi:MAG: hypothetical protein ACRD30_04150 [Bryobacteraceae bacterium]
MLRSLVDRQYCSAAHRREARLASAQAFREEEETELWAVSKARRKGSPYAKSAGQTASIFMLLAVGGLLLIAVLSPGSGGSSAPRISLDPGIKPGLLDRVSDGVSTLIQSHAPVTLHQNFSSGWSGWSSSTLARLDSPRRESRTVSDPAPVLRIWKRSIDLQNYRMEFSGAIEKRSLSWAFRAADGRNYYATKLLIAKPGTVPNAGLVRYVMMDGREWDRVQLPLPLTLDRGQNYRVRMTIEGNHFITYLDGQVISSWSDTRLHRGGIGFFEGGDDLQKVAWVDLSERDSFMGRMLAHFSLFVLPGKGPAGAGW